MLAMREQADAELVSHIKRGQIVPITSRGRMTFTKSLVQRSRMEGQRPYFRWELT